MNKETFILKTNYKRVITKLSDKQAGVLFKMLLEYVENGANAGSTDDRVDMAFEFIKMDIDLFTTSYEKRKAINSENGRRGGAPTGNYNAKQAKTTETSENNRNKPNDNDNDNDIKEINKEKNFGCLSEMEINNTIEYADRTLQKKFSKDEILNLFQAFKIQYENEFYISRMKLIQHFRNWIKHQTLNGPKKAITEKPVERFKFNSHESNS